MNLLKSSALDCWELAIRAHARHDRTLFYDIVAHTKGLLERAKDKHEMAVKAAASSSVAGLDVDDGYGFRPTPRRLNRRGPVVLSAHGRNRGWPRGPPGMTVSTPDWKRLYTECFDPRRTLRGDDLRLYVTREDAPSKYIQRALQEDGGAPKFFLSGSPGSGKSTELAQLGHLLRDTHAVIPVDAYASAANVTEVSGTEILFMMGAAACKVAVDLGFSISDEGQRGLVDAFRGVARQPDLDAERLIKGTATFAVSTGLASTGLGAATAAATMVDAAFGLARRGVAAVAEQVTIRPFGGLTRELREADPEVDRLAQALANVLAEIGAHRRPVILVDGLDRIEDPTAIRQLFVQTRLLDLPTCPVIYNGPIFLWLNPDVFALGGRFERCPLPNVAVEAPVKGSATVGPEEIARDRKLLADVVERRLAAVGLHASTVLEPGVLDRLIDESGGVLRDLIHLVHRACRCAGRAQPAPATIDAVLAERARLELAREVQPAVSNLRAIEELRTVEQTGRWSGSEESLRLVLRGGILAYHNDLPWFRVHPFLRPLLTPTGDG